MVAVSPCHYEIVKYGSVHDLGSRSIIYLHFSLLVCVHGKLLDFSLCIRRHIHLLNILRNASLIQTPHLFVLMCNSFQDNPIDVIDVLFKWLKHINPRSRIF